MRILLINSNRYQIPFAAMPVGMCSVAASLEAAGHQVKAVDLTFAQEPAAVVREETARFRPEVAGISIRNIDKCHGFEDAPLFQEVGEMVLVPLKEAGFSGPIVLGGAAVGINALEMLDRYDVEYAVQGDGERAMVELVQRFSDHRDVLDVPGVVVRRGGAIVASNPPDFIPDLDALPPPRPHRYIDVEPYRACCTAYSVQAKRGCAMHCSYCTYNFIEGKAYRLRSPRLVADEIEEFVRATGMTRVEFVDSTFNAPIAHAKALLRELAKRRLGLRLTTVGLNPGFMDEELVSLMVEAGFNEAIFGADAACDDTLRTFRKTFTVADIERAARLVHGRGLPAMWFLLAGAPGETAETLRTTLANMARIASPLDLVHIGMGIRIYKGSPIAESWAQEHGGPPPTNFLDHVGYEPEGITSRQIQAICTSATAWHHNFLMFGGNNAEIPVPLRRFFDRWMPRQPVWRAYVIGRLLEKISGLFLFRVARARRELQRAFAPAPSVPRLEEGERSSERAA